MKYFVYILTNKANTTFYIGVTNNIERRIWEHRQSLIDGLTKKYRLKKLVYLEEYQSIYEALSREKQLKNWHREWKINLIKKFNPALKNLLGKSGDAETSSA